MVALGEALRARGHVVRFVAPADFVPWLGARAFEAQSDGIDLRRTLARSSAHVDSLRWQLRYLTEELAPTLFRTVAAASNGGVDLIVGSGVQIAAASVAEQRGVPYASVVFCPCAVPSGAAPPPAVRVQTLPPFINRLLWRVGRPLANLALGGAINRGREELGLEPIEDPFTHLAGQRIVLAADRDLAPAGDDAPATLVATDAWILDEPAALDPRLEAFLRLTPPLYFGFGSMIPGDASSLVSAALAAARAVGCAALIVGGWAGLGRHLPEPAHAAGDLFAVDAVPHHLVLPRVAVAVHHGGAGTTTAAARAGVPQVVLPYILDQFYWAHRVVRLGLGPRGLPMALVNADVLTDRIATALGDTSIREAAATLAPAVASRNGVGRAADTLEALSRCRL
jgi:vancomycin aglycone glucosyltransferase